MNVKNGQYLFGSLSIVLSVAIMKTIMTRLRGRLDKLVLNFLHSDSVEYFDSLGLTDHVTEQLLTRLD